MPNTDVLHEPLVLRAGESLVDRTLVLADDFNAGTSNAVVVAAGDAVAIANTRVIGWPAWLPGSKVVGFRAQSVRDLNVDGLSIDGMPYFGVSFHGLTRATFNEVSVRHCYGGVASLNTSPSLEVKLSNVKVGELWGIGEGIGGNARPGNGFSLNSLVDSNLTDCVVAGGTVFCGCKLSGVSNVVVTRLRAPSFMVQGPNAGPVALTSSVIDKGLCEGEDLFAMNAVQVSIEVKQFSVMDCTILAARKDGHAIQVAGNSFINVAGSTIQGFNGQRGGNPAYALDLVDGSWANANFTLLNLFPGQVNLVQIRK